MDVVSLADLDGKPHASVFDAAPKTVRLELDPGESVGPQSHPGRDVLIHVLEGTLSVAVDGDEATLDAGEILRFEGEREVEPTSLADARALVVLAPSIGNNR